jgi:hypothetical protein
MARKREKREKRGRYVPEIHFSEEATKEISRDLHKSLEGLKKRRRAVNA